jgi:hypothetical protein
MLCVRNVRSLFASAVAWPTKRGFIFLEADQLTTLEGNIYTQTFQHIQIVPFEKKNWLTLMTNKIQSQRK